MVFTMIFAHVLGHFFIKNCTFMVFTMNLAHFPVLFSVESRRPPKAAQGAQRDPKGTPGRPQGPQSTANGSPKAPEREPKATKPPKRGLTSAPGQPKGPQRTANETPGHPNGPKGIQCRPKGSQRHSKDTQGKPKGQYIFTNSQSTAPANVMLYDNIR